jgi:hypothetical protein
LNSVPFNSWFRALGDFAPTTGAVGTQFGFASGANSIPWQWNLTLEGSTPGGVLSAGWVGSRSRNLLRREGILPAISLLDRESAAKIFSNEVAPALVSLPATENPAITRFKCITGETWRRVKRHASYAWSLDR